MESKDILAAGQINYKDTDGDDLSDADEIAKYSSGQKRFNSRIGHDNQIPLSDIEDNDKETKAALGPITRSLSEHSRKYEVRYYVTIGLEFLQTVTQTNI